MNLDGPKRVPRHNLTWDYESTGITKVPRRGPLHSLTRALFLGFLSRVSEGIMNSKCSQKCPRGEEFTPGDPDRVRRVSRGIMNPKGVPKVSRGDRVTNLGLIIAREQWDYGSEGIKECPVERIPCRI